MTDNRRRIKGRPETESGTGTRSSPGLNVLMVAAEAVPFAKIGGLADVAGALPAELSEFGIGTSLFMPFYREIRLKGFDPRPTGIRFSLVHGGEKRDCRVLSLKRDGATFYFLDEPEFFEREWVYGPPGGEYPDSALRFSFLSRACLLAAQEMGLTPDLVHCHDWHAALVPLYMGTGEVDPGWKEVPSLLTIHNLAYQGQFGSQIFPALGLGEEVLEKGVLEWWGNLNFLKAGILTADAVSTVSPTYASEIVTAPQGMGLDSYLNVFGSRLRGILNGLDYEIWNPETDLDLVANFSSLDPAKRSVNLEALRRQLGLYPIAEAPLFAFVGRLVQQKGADIIARAMTEMFDRGIQLVILGSGEYDLEESLLAAAKPHRGMISVNIGFNDTLARRIYASSDFFLMPSRFEPCGLGQMIAMRYGCIPVVRATGGLRDTVSDLGSDPDQGNGFVFEKDNEVDLLGAVDRAARFFREGRALDVSTRIMSEDHSWRHSASIYAKFYREILAEKGGKTVEK